MNEQSSPVFQFNTDQFQNLIATAVHAAVNARPTTGSRLPKVSCDAYNGERNTLDTWLYSFRMFADANNVPIDERTKFALTLLRTKAAEWARCHESTINAQTPWDTFVVALKAHFAPVDERRMATERLTQLKQTSTVETYTLEFLRLRTIIGNNEMSAEVTKNLYLQGLQPRLKLMVHQAKPASLQDCCDAAAAAQSIWYDATRDQRTLKMNGNQFQTGVQHALQESKPTAMELDQMAWAYDTDEQGYGDAEINRMSSSHSSSQQQRGPLSSEERQRRMNERLCFYCGGANHVAAQCRQKARNGNNDRRYGGGGGGGGGGRQNPYRGNGSGRNNNGNRNNNNNNKGNNNNGNGARNSGGKIRFNNIENDQESLASKQESPSKNE